ncbi:MAG TPA: sugar phosphate isomerase/epimerase family protein [Pirellulales bacterium]|nr:sugar phosphate isomerase/epimerase family protein [Pirellulales bacterium]
MMTPCLFSISYAGLWGQQSLDVCEFIEHAGQLGYSSVMLAGKRPHLSILDVSDERVEKIANALRAASVKAPIIGAYVDSAGGAAAEVPYLEMQIAYVERLAQVGKKLGASIVRVFTGYEAGENQTAALWKSTVTMLSEMCDRLKSLGMTVAVQNHHDLAVATDALLELLADIDRPNCKLGFDAWSPALRGEDLYEAARSAARHTVITTNADYVRFPRFVYRPALVNYEPRTPDLVRAVPFGTGFIDYSAFFSGLADGGFEGIATYEMCSPLRGGGTLDNLDRYARQYLAWMREQGFIESSPIAARAL